MVSDFYVRNRDFLRKFEPVRDDEFFTEKYQENTLKEQIKDWEGQKNCRFYIFRKEKEEQVVGTISLSNIVKGGFWSCYMGYALDEMYNGCGYMTEAVRRTVEFGFETLGLHRIEANIMPGNKASIAVVEKCGFAMEGLSRKYLKINGVWEDHVHYVILNQGMEA
jgi:ribosomal-protein-alanine N-acetyltransferase